MVDTTLEPKRDADTASELNRFDVQRPVSKILVLKGLTLFAMGLSSMTVKPAPSHMQIVTAATDGVDNIWYNPDFMASLTPKQQLGVMLHELAHALLRHCTRLAPARGFHNHMVGNIAADFEANAMVMHVARQLHGEIELPYNAMCLDELLQVVKGSAVHEGAALHFFDEEHLDADTLSAEDIYRQIMDAMANKNEEGGSGGACGDDENSGDSSSISDVAAANVFNDDTAPMEGARGGSDSLEGLDSKLAARAESAARAAKDAGVGSLGSIFEVTLDGGKLDWRVMLRRAFKSHFNRSDWSMLRPHPYYRSQNIGVPTLHKQIVGHLVLAVDTSGSVSSEELNAFASEINALRRTCGIARTTVLYIDATVVGVQEFRDNEVLELTPRGGGGTEFSPAFDWVSDNGIKPDALVYFTDGWGEWPDSAPGYKTLVVLSVSEGGAIAKTPDWVDASVLEV